ncbi:MAG: hypothetical protein R2726_22325 [Acidimicrobiales bacterium]
MSDPGPRPATLAPEPTSPGMRFAVETWAPEYGAPSGEEAVLAESTSEVDAWAECGPEQWRPLDPPPGAVAPDRLLFVDGVRRVEATVWITVPTNGSAGSSGDVHQALCASYAAGAVCCDGTARLVHTLLNGPTQQKAQLDAGRYLTGPSRPSPTPIPVFKAIRCNDRLDEARLAEVRADQIPPFMQSMVSGLRSSLEAPSSTAGPGSPASVTTSTAAGGASSTP